MGRIRPAAAAAGAAVVVDRTTVAVAAAVGSTKAADRKSLKNSQFFSIPSPLIFSDKRPKEE